MKQSSSAHDLRLRDDIVRALGYAPRTPKDFERFSRELFERQHVHISVSTLKRFWGYVPAKEGYRPNRYTLSVLSRFAGYADWEAFCRGEKMAMPADETEKRRKIDASLSRIEECLNIIYKEMDALRSLIGETEANAVFTPTDVAYGN